MFSFGVFCDVHYAENVKFADRYCENSLEKLKACLEFFRQREISLVLNLGDLIDRAPSIKHDLENLGRIRALFDAYEGRVCSVLGNHDLETLSKEDVCIHGGDSFKKTAYSFDHGPCHFLVLDANYTGQGTQYNGGNFDWTEAVIPEEQLKWIARDLEVCRQDIIVVCTHQNIDMREREGKEDPHVVRNAHEVRCILERSDKKTIVLQGHYHEGYCQNIKGIDFLTLRAMVEGYGKKNNSFAVIHVDDGQEINVEGFFRQASHVF